MRFLKASLFLFLFVITGCGVAERLEEVKPLIEDFQALYNARSFSAMYDDMVHPEFKADVDLETFNKNVGDIRNLTGERIAGNRTGFNWKSEAGKGTVVVVSFETKFINGLGHETFTFKSLEGKLKLLGYHFQAAEGFNANQADSA